MLARQFRFDFTRNVFFFVGSVWLVCMCMSLGSYLVVKFIHQQFCISVCAWLIRPSFRKQQQPIHLIHVYFWVFSKHHYDLQFFYVLYSLCFFYVFVIARKKWVFWCFHYFFALLVLPFSFDSRICCRIYSNKLLYVYYEEFGMMVLPLRCLHLLMRWSNLPDFCLLHFRYHYVMANAHNYDYHQNISWTTGHQIVLGSQLAQHGFIYEKSRTQQLKRNGKRK